jgi:hypothetical protein
MANFPPGAYGKALTTTKPTTDTAAGYDVRTDPRWMNLAVTHRADHAEFLNKLRPEQRAKVWQMMHEHANDYHVTMARKLVKK